jgi:hypothetical protein
MICQFDALPWLCRRIQGGNRADDHLTVTAANDFQGFPNRR